MKNLAKLMFLLAVLVAPICAQNATPAAKEGGGKSVDDANCGMVYGKAHSFLVCAPSGWILDNSIGSQDGIYAAFYPNGSSWESAKQSGTVMYVNTFDKPDDNYTVAKAIAFDADNTKRTDQSAIPKKGEPIKLGDLAVPVQLFTPGGFNRFEASAYIDSPKVIIMFVMTSKDEDAFKRDYLAFVQLVQSYKFLSSNVTVQYK